MRVFTRRVAWGVLTALLTYLATAVAVRDRLTALLAPVGPESAPGPLARAYTTAGEPFAQAVGWVFLSSHRLPLFAVGPEEVLAIGLHVPAASGAVWLYGVPAAGCLVGGALVATLDGPADPLPVGGGLAVGYVPAVLAGVGLFRGGSGAVAVYPNVASVVTVDWPLAVVGYPVVFASLGVLVVRECAVVVAAIRR